MFKKFLAKLGVGAARVDLQFKNRPYEAGDVVNGELQVHGGEVAQEINGLSIRFIMNATVGNGETVSRQVASIPISNSFMIHEQEQKIIPFTYTIPENIPLSRANVSYYFDTHLDIESGVDKKDIDMLIVDAPSQLKTIFQALGRLGFREHATSGKLDQYGQEFAFFPTEHFVGQLQEIELRFAYEVNGVRVWLEADCIENFKKTEAKTEFVLTKEQLENEAEVAMFFKERIANMIANPYTYTTPFSFKTPHHSQGMGAGIPGMIGGLAVGLLGGMLLSAVIEDIVEDVLEETAFGEVEEEEEGFDFGDFSFGDDE